MACGDEKSPLRTTWRDHFCPPEKPTEIAQVVFVDDRMRVVLTDGRRLEVPLTWFPLLRQATTPEREAFHIIDGTWIRWEGLDEDIDLEGLLRIYPGGLMYKGLETL